MRKHGVSVFGQAHVSARGGGGTCPTPSPLYETAPPPSLFCDCSKRLRHLESDAVLSHSIRGLTASACRQTLSPSAPFKSYPSPHANSLAHDASFRKGCPLAKGAMFLPCSGGAGICMAVGVPRTQILFQTTQKGLRGCSRVFSIRFKDIWFIRRGAGGLRSDLAAFCVLIESCSNPENPGEEGG